MSDVLLGDEGESLAVSSQVVLLGQGDHLLGHGTNVLGAGNGGFDLAILNQGKFRRFPDETADLADKLNDPQFHSILVQQYAEFREALAENPKYLRFRYHKLDKIGKRLDELHTPLREYQTDMMYPPLVRQFITDDEVNRDLTGRGSGFSGGKARIWNYWQENHSTRGNQPRRR